MAIHQTLKTEIDFENDDIYVRLKFDIDYELEIERLDHAFGIEWKQAAIPKRAYVSDARSLQTGKYIDAKTLEPYKAQIKSELEKHLRYELDSVSL